MLIPSDVSSSLCQLLSPDEPVCYRLRPITTVSHTTTEFDKVIVTNSNGVRDAVRLYPGYPPWLSTLGS